MNTTNMHTYRSVDDWLGRQSYDVQSAHKRLKWSFIYLSDALVECVNHYQLALFGTRSRWLSRILVVLFSVIPAVLIEWLVTGSFL